MEHITTPKVEQVKLLDRYTSKKPAVGTLYLTATHLIYVETTSNVRKETWILHHHIATVEKLPLTTIGCPLLIHCKNFRVAHFVLPRERDCQDVSQSLLRLSQPAKEEELYAFLYNPKQNETDRKVGWGTVDLKMEFKRMGLPNDFWELTDLNKNYGICSTYPSELAVPKAASKPTIVGSSKFRSRGRFPVLSYFHKETNAAVCRCSQPLSGFSARCVEDEQMLQAISKANPKSSFMYVVDTRPKLNAMANRAAGKGYENEDHYANIRFQFVGIENIHVMRNSLQKLMEVCTMKSPTMSDYLTGLENSGWLRHIKAVMDAGVVLAKAVTEEKASVLVHCSDGWDRTAQVCSLASILLDPYYRTIRGLMVLIEKEWISMGHKFTQRCGHLEGDPKEVSPVFTQFIECLWHLMEQYPCAFEFNERYLIEIHDHVYSCQFGNFIGNCQKERVELKLEERTYSVWPFLLEKREQFVNPLYKGTSRFGVLRPNTLPFNFKFWCAMYNRFDKGMHPKQSILDHLLTLSCQKAKEEEKVKELQKKLAAIDGVLPNQVHPCPDNVSAGQSTVVPPATCGSSVHEVECTTQLTNGTSEETDSSTGSDSRKEQVEWPGPESTLTITNGKTVAMEIPETNRKAEVEFPRNSTAAVEE
ncbi:myotubularin-related protein 8 [Megalops cyprinoides]|uniref:myotubularin-related protein 8 n=1 Tax=Megalops cyprinoides TaxID=118141 RepID=UPI0018642124|nr:myotubularin-related protein 8 [Megalops cyprinoides]